MRQGEGTDRLGFGGGEQTAGSRPAETRRGKMSRQMSRVHSSLAGHLLTESLILLMTVLMLTRDPDPRQLCNSAVTVESWRSSTKWDN